MDTENGIPALKERAGVVNALIEGDQTVLVRHPTLDPGTITDRFVLYPAYTHQHPDRYQDQHVDYYHRASTKPDAGIPVRAVADVTAEYTVSSDSLDALSNHYVYTPAGLRDKYDVTDGLRVLVCRVATLETPTIIDEDPSYRGCRAWIELSSAVNIDPAAATPVLDDPTFAERHAAIRVALK